MDIKELIYNPTQDLLDDYLYQLNLKSGEHNDTYKELKELQYKESVEVDTVCNEKDESGKKKFTYKNQAESFVQEQNRERTDKIAALEAKRNVTEKELEIMKMNYYHARAKLGENKMIDSQAAHNGAQDFNSY